MSEQIVSIILNKEFFYNFINYTLYSHLEDILHYMINQCFIEPSSSYFINVLSNNNIDKSSHKITLYTNDKIIFKVELSKDKLYIVFKFSIQSNKDVMFYKSKKITYSSLQKCVYDICDFKDFIGSMPAWDCDEREEYINNDSISVNLRDRFL
jgi:hypothetical protein